MAIWRGQVEPYLLAIQTNQPMAYVNLDPVAHNAHITVQPRSGNKEINYAMQPHLTPKIESVHALWDWIRGRHRKQNARLRSLQFPNPEMYIRFKCDVHPWEFAYVCVLDHPFCDCFQFLAAKPRFGNESLAERGRQ
jgi:hypothetical protein